jgi:heavy metal sensor kinase
MTLVNRVSAYFLAALAVVLAACSALFYGIVSRQMNEQFSHELHSALHALVAAVEVEPDAAKWQPSEHLIGLGAREGPDEIRWVVIGDRGAIVEASRTAGDEFIAAAEGVADGATDGVTETQSPVLPGWEFLSRRLVAPAPVHVLRELDEFDAITVVVARSTEVLDMNLRRLAGLATLLPIGGWLAAAAVGRWFCRRALEPVLAMARQARSMSGADFQLRMPVSESQDELTDLGEAFNSVLDRLQRSYEGQRRFTGDAAHELRTPLTVLLGQIDVSLRKPRSSEEYRYTLELLRNEAGELRQILESLLFLARAEEDALPPDATAFQLAAWLPTYMNRWEEHPRRADIQLELHNEAEVTASPPLLNRLLDNLVGNALKYSDAGTPVVVRLSREDGDSGEEPTVRISVTDRGNGIAPEDVPSIFEPFFRAKHARTSGVAGAGLGLAIAQRIAASMHGKLTCESTLGQGTTFTLALPGRCVSRSNTTGG